MNGRRLYLGCAGWTLGREYWPEFASVGSHLQRYAGRLNAVEINSAFYRPHRPATYARWAASVGQGFRFAVKVPKAITHEQRLQGSSALLEAFLSQCSALGERLGCLLVQLPPSLAFDPDAAQAFFRTLRAQYPGDVVLEPRHESWAEAGDLLVSYRIAQAVVDPSRLSTDTRPGGWQGVRYWRLHGTPRLYYSAYEDNWLEHLAQQIEASLADGVPTWCIFDNTARGAAVGNALFMGRLLELAGSPATP
ncbi:DUF72 domain-containing protein [Pseudomonas sp.]|uniref:DUF72 domain-containing protein n=1 Tax=Pseudomonas sp. TaxID=306 RepID=UPI00258F6BCD|nr:DUF72 domain-containing protein [Pseudomonas sp.]